MLFCLLGAGVAGAAGVYFLSAPGDTVVEPQVRPGPVERAKEVTAPKVAVTELTIARPVRLIIPKLGIDAAVEKVGLTDDRTMESPSGPDTVGWYGLGPRPGEIGSAVMDGHSGYRDGRAAVFDDLSELGKGDTLRVEDARGQRISFVVRETKLYARDASTAEVFASTSGRRLNLITCTGRFDIAAGTHEERLVIFAEARRQEPLLPRQ